MEGVLSNSIKTGDNLTNWPAPSWMIKNGDFLYINMYNSVVYINYPLIFT
jgi:hypothetical protein